MGVSPPVLELKLAGIELAKPKSNGGQRCGWKFKKLTLKLMSGVRGYAGVYAPFA